MKHVPNHIIKKSRNYYYDTVHDRYIHRDQLATRLAEMDREAKDKQIRAKRWDLND